MNKANLSTNNRLFYTGLVILFLIFIGGIIWVNSTIPDDSDWWISFEISHNTTIPNKSIDLNDSILIYYPSENDTRK